MKQKLYTLKKQIPLQKYEDMCDYMPMLSSKFVDPFKPLIDDLNGVPETRKTNEIIPGVVYNKEFPLTIDDGKKILSLIRSKRCSDEIGIVEAGFSDAPQSLKNYTIIKEVL